MAKPKPEKPLVQIPVRLDPDLHARLRTCAEAGGKSVNRVVSELLDRQLAVKGY